MWAGLGPAHLTGLLALHDLDELLVLDLHLHQLHLVRERDGLQLRALLLSLGHALLRNTKSPKYKKIGPVATETRQQRKNKHTHAERHRGKKEAWQDQGCVSAKCSGTEISRNIQPFGNYTYMWRDGDVDPVSYF